MRNFCACMITTSLKIMLPKCVLSMHTTSINQPLHIVHTGHVSATLSVSMYCARRTDAALRAPRGQHPLWSGKNWGVRQPNSKARTKVWESMVEMSKKV